MAHSRPFLLLALVAFVGAVVVPVAAADEPLLCFGQVVNVTGTDGDDLIDLTDGTHGSGPFVVAAFAGKDRVVGSGGDDVVCLGSGNDEFVGGEGDDVASGDLGADRLRGGPGDDTLYGDSGNDRLFGSSGHDDLDGGGDNDLLEGHEGNDFLVGATGDDILRGGRGDDDADGGPGNDEVRGGKGPDSIDGGAGDDLIFGGAGSDILDGDDAPAIVPTNQAGVDEIHGGPGFDELYANWTFFDGDVTGLLDGGADYDACALGATQEDCERDHRNSTDGGEEWRSTISEVFGRWGLDIEACGTINDLEHCVGGQVDFAIDVMMCESSGWPFAYNTSSGATGLFQNLKGYWSSRVNAAIALASADGITTTLTTASEPRDPVANIEIAAYLVYTSRETLIGDKLYGGAGYPDNWVDGSDPEGDPYDNYTFPHYHSGWQKGPNPWGHWTCGDNPGVDAWNPAWIHPNADPQP